MSTPVWTTLVDCEELHTALGRPEVVTDATRKRVLEAVRATGYVPNLAAGALASSRSRLVAIFLPTIANSIFADTVQALTDRLAAAGYQTLLGLTGYRPEQEEADRKSGV